MSGVFGGALNGLKGRLSGKLQERGLLPTNFTSSFTSSATPSSSSGQRARGSSFSNLPSSPDQYTRSDFLRLLAQVKDGLTEAASGRLADSVANSREGAKAVQRLVEGIRRATEAIVWGERNDDTVFDLFNEQQALPCFVSTLLSPSTPHPVKVQLLQTVSIVLLNSSHETSFFYLLSGGYLNTLLAGALDSEDDEVGYVYGALDLNDEEVLSYFINLVKGLALRLDGSSCQLCVDERVQPSEAQGFPLFAQAVRFSTHRDLMVRTASRTALLHVLSIEHPKVRSFTVEAAKGMLVPSLVRAFGVAWSAAGLAVQLGDSSTLQVALEAEQDLLEFLNDLMLLDVTAVCEVLARDFLAGALLPLLKVLAPVPTSPSAVQSDETCGTEVKSNTSSRRPSVPEEMIQALASQAHGLDPAQRGLVDNVVARVLAGQGSTSGESETIGSPRRTRMRMVTCSEENANVTSPGPSPRTSLPACMAAPTAAVAVHAIAACARMLGTHRSIIEPVAKVLLLPSLPSAVAAAVHDPGPDGSHLSAVVDGACKSSWPTPFISSAGYPRTHSDAPLAEGGADTAAGGEEEAMPPNPFREAFVTLIYDKTLGPTPVEAPIAAWAMLELQAVLPRSLQEDLGLLPRPNFSRDNSIAEVKDVRAESKTDPAEVTLPLLLIRAVRVGGRLPRIAQRAITSALIDLVSAPRARMARIHAASAANMALQEAANTFRESFAPHSEVGGGADALAAFLEEWDWHRQRDAHVDLHATCGGIQCLLRTGVGFAVTARAAENRGPTLNAQHAARALLTLRRLCTDLAALGEEGPQAEPDLSAGSSSSSLSVTNQQVSSRGRRPSIADAADLAEYLTTGENTRSASPGIAVPLHAPGEALEIVECREPSKKQDGSHGVQYTSQRTLVLHPTLLIVTEPPIGDGSVAVVRVRIPVWQIASSIDASDPCVLQISKIASLADLSLSSVETNKRRLVLQFSDLRSCARALMHIEGSRAREVQHLLKQLEIFVDATVDEVVAERSNDTTPRTASVDGLATLARTSES